MEVRGKKSLSIVTIARSEGKKGEIPYILSLPLCVRIRTKPTPGSVLGTRLEVTFFCVVPVLYPCSIFPPFRASFVVATVCSLEEHKWFSRGYCRSVCAFLCPLEDNVTSRATYLPSGVPPPREPPVVDGLWMVWTTRRLR